MKSQFCDLFEHIKSCLESSIDFPRDGLSSGIWMFDGKNYRILPDVKKKIMSLLQEYPRKDLLALAKDIRITGSIGTNQYSDDSDIDVHIVPKRLSGVYGDEDFQKDVMKFYKDLNYTISDHPMEVYIQSNSKQDLMSDSCYDLEEEQWLVGPKLVPVTHDPYEDFSGVLQDLRDVLGETDELFGELKRDVVDFNVIGQAIQKMNPEQQKIFLVKLKSKLKEIEDTIHDLYSKRKEWVDMRRNSSKVSSVEQAKNDAEMVKGWEDKNALFKFIGRYKYLKIIQELENLLKDGKFDSSDVKKINKITKEF
jgi:hypothetical protein